MSCPFDIWLFKVLPGFQIKETMNYHDVSWER